MNVIVKGKPVNIEQVKQADGKTVVYVALLSEDCKDLIRVKFKDDSGYDFTKLQSGELVALNVRLFSPGGNCYFTYEKPLPSIK